MPHTDAVNELRAALLGGRPLTNVQTGFLLAVLGSLDGAVRRYETATDDHPQLTGAKLDHYRAEVTRSLVRLYRAEVATLSEQPSDPCRL